MVQASPASPLIGEATAASEPRYEPDEQFYNEVPLATNGSGYLAIVSSLSTIEAVEITQDGQVDQTPVLVDNDACFDSDLFWSGSDYVLFCLLDGIAFYRITEELTATPQQSLVESEQGGVGHMTVAQGDGRFLIAWNEDNLVIRGMLLEDNGMTLTSVTPEPFVIADGPGERDYPHAEWLGEAFFVAYRDNRFVDVPSSDIRGTLVEIDGTVETTDGRELVADPVERERPWKVVAGDPGALMVFSSTGDTVSVILDATGHVVDGTERLHPNSSFPYPGEIGAAWIGDGWLVKMRSRFDLHIVAADPSMEVIRGTLSFSTAHSSAIVWQGDRGLLVGNNVPLINPGEVAAQQVDRNGGAGEVAYLKQIGQPIRGPVVASDGTSYLLRYGYFLTSFAGPLEPNGTPFGQEWELAETSFETRTIGAGRGRYIVASRPSSNVRGYMLDIDTGPTFAFFTDSSSDFGAACCAYDIARSDAGYLVAATGTGLHAARLDADGIEIDREYVRLSANPARVTAVAAAGMGDQYLTAFVREESPSTAAGLYGLRTTHSELAVLDRDAIAISVAPNNPRGPVVLKTGSEWLVGWAEDAGVGFASLDAEGTFVVTPTVTATPLIPQLEVMGAFGGTHALFAWLHEAEPPGTFQVVGLVVDPAGNETPSPITLASESGISALAGVTSVGGDQFLVVYARFDPVANAPRLFSRVVALTSPLGSPCTSDADCAPNSCVDGVCCNSTCGGGDASDCQACSIEGGGRFDGTCGPLAAGASCRDASAICDAAEVCDGAALDCPPDLPVVNGASCDDGNLCNGIHACADGLCILANILDCNDANECTDDRCDALTGCEHDPVSCIDADPCTADTCDPSTGCEFPPLDCDDLDRCTRDFCDSSDGGCQHEPIMCDGADWVELQNDGFEFGMNAGFQAGFIIGEEYAATLVPPSGRPYKVEAVRILFGGSSLTQDVVLRIYADSAGTESPGPILFVGEYSVTGVSDRFNEIVLSEEDIFVEGAFRVSFEVTHTGFPSVARDDDGTFTVNRNWINASSGIGWVQSSSLGTTGDWIVRAFVSVDDDGAGGASGSGGVAGTRGDGTGGAGGAGGTNQGGCDTERDCPGGQYCGPGGACTFDCGDDTPCPDGRSCNASGQCEASSGGGCQTAPIEGLDLMSLMFLALLIRRRQRPRAS